jgi:hypothetical protein
MFYQQLKSQQILLTGDHENVPSAVTEWNDPDCSNTPSWSSNLLNMSGNSIFFKLILLNYFPDNEAASTGKVRDGSQK